MCRHGWSKPSKRRTPSGRKLFRFYKAEMGAVSRVNGTFQIRWNLRLMPQVMQSSASRSSLGNSSAQSCYHPSTCCCRSYRNDSHALVILNIVWRLVLPSSSLLTAYIVLWLALLVTSAEHPCWIDWVESAVQDKENYDLPVTEQLTVNWCCGYWRILLISLEIWRFCSIRVMDFCEIHCHWLTSDRGLQMKPAAECTAYWIWSKLSSTLLLVRLLNYNDRFCSELVWTAE